MGKIQLVRRHWPATYAYLFVECMHSSVLFFFKVGHNYSNAAFSCLVLWRRAFAPILFCPWRTVCDSFAVSLVKVRQRSAAVPTHRAARHLSVVPIAPGPLYRSTRRVVVVVVVVVIPPEAVPIFPVELGVEVIHPTDTAIGRVKICTPWRRACRGLLSSYRPCLLSVGVYTPGIRKDQTP